MWKFIGNFLPGFLSSPISAVFFVFFLFGDLRLLWLRVQFFHPLNRVSQGDLKNLGQNLPQALKEALMEHPRHQARHEEEWREAVERIHERLLQESGRRFFGNETLNSKKLRKMNG